LKRDRDRFALVQKVKNGMPKMDADINAEMLIMGGKANAWIMTEDVSIYCRHTLLVAQINIGQNDCLPFGQQ
jgi:hypothetical protein